MAKKIKVKDIEEALTYKRPKPQPLAKEDFVSTGSTLLNLACSGNTTCGFGKGRYYRFVGDSSSGKTFLALTCLAEAANNPHFDKYDLYFDDSENGVGFDFGFFFGEKMKDRVLPPSGDHKKPDYSTTLEHMYDRLYKMLKKCKKEKKSLIYVLDSIDPLQSEADHKKYVRQSAEREKARQKGELADQAGDMGMARGKTNSAGMRLIIPLLRDTRSILVIVGQTRDAYQPPAYKAYVEKQTTAGGHSLKFYNSLELWTSIKGPIVKNVRKKDRKQGIYAVVRTKKNRGRGVDRKILIPIYHSHGIDDTGACVDYLVEESHWKKGDGGINAKEFKFKGNKEQLVRHIQEKDLDRKLQLLVRDVWNQIEKECSIVRKPRYQ